MATRKPLDEVCRTCMFAHDGYCRRFPPQFMIYQDHPYVPITFTTIAAHPKIEDGHWCGEWKLKR